MKALIVILIGFTGFMAHASNNDRVVLYDYHQEHFDRGCPEGEIPMYDSQTGEIVNCLPGRAPQQPDDRYRYCSQYVLDHRDQGANVIAFEQCKAIWPIITIPVN